MRTRLDLLDTLPKGSTGAELGVFAGDFSDWIIHRVAPRVLYMVDLFTGMVTSGDQNGENLRTINMGDALVELRRRYPFSCDHEQPVRAIIQADSVEWLRSMPANSLDWVYIDTDHTYARTMCELREARRVVKHGGIIAGHDFACEEFSGVVCAVMDFVRHANPQPPLEIWAGDRLPSYRIPNFKVSGKAAPAPVRELEVV